jgi:hypothetical protein
MGWISGLMFGLFFPAGVGLVWRLVTTPVLAYQLLVATLVLLLLEQAHMAVVDWQNITRVGSSIVEPKLPLFKFITCATIGIELVGFYAAIFTLGWGTVLVIVSQLFFNGLAPLQLQPDSDPPVVSQGAGDRVPVLVANGLGLVVLGLWIAKQGELVMASILLGLVLVYGGIKYGKWGAQG